MKGDRRADWKLDTQRPMGFDPVCVDHPGSFCNREVAGFPDVVDQSLENGSTLQVQIRYGQDSSAEAEKPRTSVQPLSIDIVLEELLFQ